MLLFHDKSSEMSNLILKHEKWKKKMSAVPTGNVFFNQWKVFYSHKN
jgi:hypothetical protein